MSLCSMCLLVVFGQLTFADLLGRPDECEPVLLVEFDAQLAPGHVDGYRALAPAVRDRSRCDRDGARAGGGRLPRSALPDQCGDIVRAVDAYQLNVRALREAVARLDPGSEPEQVCPNQGRAYDRVR